MAEFAATATILQITSFALHSAHVLCEFIDSVIDAPRDIRSIRKDLPTLQTLVPIIKICLDSGVIRDMAHGLIQDTLKTCDASPHQLRQLLGRFIIIHGKRLKWNSAFVWRLSRDKIARLRGNIDQSKQTLSLLLAVAQAQAVDTGNRRLSQRIDEAIQPVRLELLSFYQKLLEWKRSRQRSSVRREVLISSLRRQN